jgi:tRNA-modifying protein YgfZ
MDEDSQAGAGPPNGGGGLTDELVALRSGLAIVRAGLLDLFTLSGSQRRDALQRVVSQDVGSLRAGEGRIALLLAPKGQFRAMLAVFETGDEFIVATPAGRGGALAEELGKYVRFSRCTLQAFAAETVSVALFGPLWEDVAGGCGADVAALAASGLSRRSQRSDAPLWLGESLLGVRGAVVTANVADALGEVVGVAEAHGAAALSRQALELERIRIGWPAWGAELTHDVLPPEVGIEKVAISYTKGCYVGQETIARMQTYGHPNRQLVGIRQLAGPREAPPLPLELSAPGNEKRRGELTSFARHPELGGVGLAVIRRQFADPGTPLEGGAWSFEAASLPLW